MPTILHISDLHRTSGPRLHNDELLAAIVSDAARWSEEGIPIPDIVVVSGDLVQGASLNTPNADEEITAQYDEAHDFLERLAAEFLNSDRSRVVIIPGNHDIHWGRARNAMTALVNCPDRIRIKAFKPTSNVRWNWDEQQAYEISDRDLYDSRFEHFRKFRADFYARLDPSPLWCNHDLVLFSYPSLRLTVAGFPSWYGNDCFCNVGEIDSASLTSSRELIRDSEEALVAVAVWHHNIRGGPRVHDYMDHRVIHKLIDFGFNVGLHGHQHYPGAAPFELGLPNLTSMAVVGAGSLAVGDRALPMGERRQFNIVDIDTDANLITVHVRAMSSGGVFAGSHRDDFGGNTFIKLCLPRSSLSRTVSTPARRRDRAMTAVARGEFERALELAVEIDVSHSYERRQVEIKALEGMKRWGELIELLDPPQNVDEAVMAISLLLDARRFEDASQRLNAASALVGPALLEELTKTIAARRMAS